MAISSTVRSEAEAALQEFCLKHSAAPGADRLRYVYEVQPNAVLLLAERPGFMNPKEWVPKPMAKFRYSEARNEWSLYWCDSSEKWHRVSNVKSDKDIRVLVGVVVSDPLGVFWS